MAAVDRELGPPVAGQQAPRFGPDVVAVAPDQGPFGGLDTDLRQVAGQAEIVELANRVRLEVDTDPEGLKFPHRLIDPDRHADLVAGERQRQPGDPGTGDQNGVGVSGHQGTLGQRRPNVTLSERRPRR